MKKIKLPKLLIISAVLYAIIQILYTRDIMNGYILHIINQSLIYVILAVSLNLINGITGQFSLGHMGCAAVGAYASGTLTSLVFKINPSSPGAMPLFILAIVAGGVAAAIIGILGVPTLFYLVIAYRRNAPPIENLSETISN